MLYIGAPADSLPCSLQLDLALNHCRISSAEAIARPSYRPGAIHHHGPRHWPWPRKSLIASPQKKKKKRDTPPHVCPIGGEGTHTPQPATRTQQSPPAHRAAPRACQVHGTCPDDVPACAGGDAVVRDVRVSWGGAGGGGVGGGGLGGVLGGGGGGGGGSRDGRICGPTAWCRRDAVHDVGDGKKKIKSPSFHIIYDNY
jgi:hypothetical protein